VEKQSTDRKMNGRKIKFGISQTLLVFERQTKNKYFSAIHLPAIDFSVEKPISFSFVKIGAVENVGEYVLERRRDNAKLFGREL